MDDSRRQAYLEAMGIDVWLLRPEPPEAPGLLGAEAGAGQKRILAVCERPDQADSRIAADVARALGDDLAWAWPDDSGQAGAPRMTDLVDERLFTEVVVFGASLASALGCKSGVVMGSARVYQVASLDELEVSPQARRELWQTVVSPVAH